MASKVINVTPEELKALNDELENLKTTKRKEVIEAISYALSLGDLSENSEYDEAKNEQGEVETRIANLEATLELAVILDDSDVKTDKVSVGNLVTIRDFEHDKEYEYRVVGSTESDPFAVPQRISDDSPIGKALIGARTGDTVNVETPRGVRKYIIESISK